MDLSFRYVFGQGLGIMVTCLHQHPEVGTRFPRVLCNGPQSVGKGFQCYLCVPIVPGTPNLDQSMHACINLFPHVCKEIEQGRVPIPVSDHQKPKIADTRVS